MKIIILKLGEEELRVVVGRSLWLRKQLLQFHKESLKKSNYRINIYRN